MIILRNFGLLMIRQCGRCKAILGEKEPLEDRSITTTFCDPCKDAWLREELKKIEQWGKLVRRIRDEIGGKRV
jgi:hypothetical protein